jgi:translation elongation factor EF-1alpha
MVINKEFLQAEISALEQESQKAHTFLIQAQATISAYRMLINKLDEPEIKEES